MTLENYSDSVKQMEVADFLTILFGILIGLLVVFGVIYAIAKAKKDMTDSSSPVCKAHARVVERSNVPTNPNSIIIASYIDVVFELNSGDRKRFVIKGSDYYNYSIGDEGMLQWQGSSLISCDRGAKPEFNKPQQNGATGATGSIPAWKRVQMEKEKNQ